MSRIFRRVTASILTVVFTLAILLTAGNDTISQADTAVTYSPAHTASVIYSPCSRPHCPRFLGRAGTLVSWTSRS